MRGQYIINPGTRQEIILPNTVVDAGEVAFLKMCLQGDGSVVSVGGNYYIGLCGDGQTETTTLSTLVGEPTATNGYARQAITRDTTGWPLVDLVVGTARARSRAVTFSASGGDYNTAFTRFFLCSVGSGTSGVLFSYSAPLPEAYLLKSGNAFPVAYELYLE